MANDYLNSPAASQITVFPAQAGNQCHYKVQSSTRAQLDTRLREYDEIVGSLKIAAFLEITAIPKITVFPAKAGNQCHYEVQSSTHAQLDTRVREYDGVRTKYRTKQAESIQ